MKFKVVTFKIKVTKYIQLKVNNVVVIRVVHERAICLAQPTQLKKQAWTMFF